VLGAIALAELVGWTIRFRSIGPLFEWMTHTVAALAHAGDRSAASLEKLKDTRERVRDELATESGDRGKRVTDETAPIPLAQAKRRFDAGDQPAGKPLGDLRDALGGAKAVEPSTKQPKPARPPAETGAEEDDQDTTSRLLRAKRRARRDEGSQQ